MEMDPFLARATVHRCWPPPLDCALYARTANAVQLGGQPLRMHSLGHFHTGSSFALSDHARRLHLAIMGATGTGKSTLLSSLMRDDLLSGRGFALIDPHGDLAEAIASAVPPSRINDVIYFDPSDRTHAVGLNPLSYGTDDAVLTANIVASFKHIWRDSWGPRMEYILGNAIRLLLSTPGSTLVSLPLLLVDDEYRETLLQQCNDPVIRLFWQTEYPGYSEKLRSEAIAPIQNKIGQLVGNPSIRAILGQKSTIDFNGLINGRKILLANLSKRIGDEPSHLLGAFLVTAIAQEAQRRSTIPEEKRQDFTLYVDEFQNFATETFASILSEMRKWRLNLVVANQFLGQVPDTLRQSVIGNAGTIAVFRVGAEDAPLLARHLDVKNPQTLTDTANFHAWVKTTSDGSPTTAALIRTPAPAAFAGSSLQAIIERTHNRHARLKTSVERSIARLFPEHEKPPKRRRKPRWT